MSVVNNRHILFIDPLEKLLIKKDSTLMLALSLQQSGLETLLLFENDFYCSNTGHSQIDTYSFSGEYEEDGIHLKEIKLLNKKTISFTKNDILHMRIDPPFDSRYLRYLWMLKSIKLSGVKVINNPEGILLFNEKLYAFEQEDNIPSYVGSSEAQFENFAKEMKAGGSSHLILKPLDLYQGIGVQKISIDETLLDNFKKKITQYQGPVVAQPFIKEVTKGEVRSIFYKGTEIGSIIKVPASGEYLANIAQGATYKLVELSPTERETCNRICSELQTYGVDFIAFDILGGKVSEVNITCPGLLVEVSKAAGINLAKKIINLGF